MATFLDRHGLLEIRNRPRWFTVEGGARRYVEAITRQLGARLRLNTPVGAIERHASDVTVAPVTGQAERFDQVVIATHADQALKMLRDPTRIEREVLGAMRYQENEAVLHTDRSLLPRRRAAWASWNFHLLTPPPNRATVTYYMNKLQQLNAREHYCVTLNRTREIDPGRIIRKFTYAHPVYTCAAEQAQHRHGEISGRNRTHYCGAYWGFGFHEDGVESAVRVADALGVGRLG
jgi:predicted NAD/FAD-binding protein